MSNQELIVVKQLPQIEEHLKELSLDVDKKVENAKNLVCTEENVTTIKQIRASLNKEFKELSHGFGAAIGYSMINDEIKTIDDAINEATIDMRNNKEEVKN